MSQKTDKNKIDAKIALCYIRLSWTRDENDSNSPERQRANIQAVCDTNGWTPEFYQDVEGHKSATQEKNRPGWLALKARLSEPDVVALVANDLARLHRKGWRIGDLLDFVDKHNVKLVLAAPGKNIDFSTISGRIFAQLLAIFDEWYALDISQRAKDMIAYRKKQGKTVGLPPFGTRRNPEGYLIPSDEGAWLMPDGTFIAGTKEESPDSGALWRGYYDCAERALELYAENKRGIVAIAHLLHIEGWAFRDRQGQPSVFHSEDVRRITANWREYGGYVSEKRARERHPHDYNNDVTLNPERAVFSLELLYKVGEVRRQRTVRYEKPIQYGVSPNSFHYALQGLVYCAHCEKLAQERGDDRLRTRLGGWISNNTLSRRYRHVGRVHCDCVNKSVLIDQIESDVARLLSLLEVKSDEENLLLELGLQIVKLEKSDEQVDLEVEKQVAVGKLKRQLEAAKNLYADGEMSREEYLRRKENFEREIVHWESRTAETEQASLELALCVEAVNKIANLWEAGEAEDRQGMARSFFSHIVYDLDQRRITDFRLKPWADRFLTVREALHEEQDPNNTSGNETLCKPTGSLPVGATNRNKLEEPL